jgi:hypothetical protein|tara:strand:+ start:1461 stop:1778 length:318 start_codon:yes stop_codon:yes gene_type:complete
MIAMNSKMESTRIRLAKLLDGHPTTSGMSVRVHGDHLILARLETLPPATRPEDDDRVRITRLKDRTYGLSVKRHTGRWQKTPFVGSLDEMVSTIQTFMQHLVASY